MKTSKQMKLISLIKPIQWIKLWFNRFVNNIPTITTSILEVGPVDMINGYFVK